MGCFKYFTADFSQFSSATVKICLKVADWALALSTYNSTESAPFHKISKNIWYDMPVYSLVFNFFIMENFLTNDGKKINLVFVHATYNFKSSISLNI